MSTKPVTFDLNQAKPVTFDLGQAKPLQSGGQTTAAQPSVTPAPQQPAAPNVSDGKPQYASGFDRMTAEEPVASGFAKSFGQTVNFISKGLNKIPYIGETLAPSEGIHAMDLLTTLHNDRERAGAAMETIGEFALGDAAAVKGLSAAAKMQRLAEVTNFLAKYPRLARIAGIGLRQGALGTAQSLAHGADVPTALEEGAITGATGSALEGAGMGVKSVLKKIRPSTTTIAGETMPKLASQEPQASRLAHEVGSIDSAPKIAAQQQSGAQQAVRNMASTAAESASVKATDDAALKEGAESLYDKFAAASKKLKSTAQQTRTAKSFGDAAEQVRESARPIYEKFDAATNGEFSRLKNARNSAYRAKDFAKVEEINSQIDDLWRERTASMNTDEYDAGRRAWRDSKVLDRIHAAVEQSFNIRSEEAATRTGLERNISGAKLQRGLNSLLKGDGQAEVERVIGKTGVDNLHRIADLLTRKQAATRDVASNVAGYWLRRHGKSAAIGGLVGGATDGYKGAAVGALAGAAGEDATMRVLHAAATNPKVGKMIADAVKVGASPRVYGPLISAALNNSNQQ